MSPTDLKQKVADTAEKAKDAAMSAVDVAKEAGRTARDEVSDKVSETYEAVREVAADSADSMRASIADSGDRMAQTLHDKADQSPGTQARILNGVANGMERASDTLRNRTVGELMSTVTDYARKHPGVFAAGAAVAGFALARFLRSSSSASAAAARAVEETSRIYHDAARGSVDTLGRGNASGRGSRP